MTNRCVSLPVARRIAVTLGALCLFGLASLRARAEGEGANPAAGDGASAGRIEALEKKLAEQEKRTAEQERLTEEVVRRLQATEDAAAVASGQDEDRKINLYGFSDAGFRKVWLKPQSHYLNLINDKASFLLGSANIYFDAMPHPRVRALSEVRFSLYPNGQFDAATLQNQSTTNYDLTSATGRNSVAWSGIVLERAGIEYRISDLARVMIGYFLTPYGIWNVDHGAPTLISSALPAFFASEYFPTHLTGLQLLGSTAIGKWEIGYRAYLTNGRNQPLTDNQDNKLFGGRVFTSTRFGKTSATLGASAFRGSYLQETYSVNTQQGFALDARPTVKYDEWGVATDLSVDSGPFRLRTEFVFNRTEYATGLRALSYGGGSFQPDNARWDTYVVAAYRLPWLGIEPYVFGDCERRVQSDANRHITLSVGVNIRLNAAAQIKLQYLHIMFADGPAGTDPSVDDFDDLDVRFVVAF